MTSQFKSEKFKSKDSSFEEFQKAIHEGHHTEWRRYNKFSV